MKSPLSAKFLALCAAVALTLPGCYIDLDDDDGISLGPSVRGSGTVITETRITAAFTQIELEGEAQVYLRQGADQALAVEADDNVVPIITTRVRDGRLEIGSADSYRSDNPVNIYVTVPEIRGLKIDGAGDIYGETSLAGEELALEVRGSGDMDLDLYYPRLRAEGSGSGDFLLRGEVDEQEVSLLGSGNYRADELASQTCDIRISGSGDATVAVEEYLSAEIRGSGNIRYSGRPRVDTSVTGSGNVIGSR